MQLVIKKLLGTQLGIIQGLLIFLNRKYESAERKTQSILRVY
jgi:hypothetical protein